MYDMAFLALSNKNTSQNLLIWKYAQHSYMTETYMTTFVKSVGQTFTKRLNKNQREKMREKKRRF